MYAIIETGGKQYKVEPGQKIQFEKLEHDGKTIVFEKVLAIGGSDSTFSLGKPYLSGAKVTAEFSTDGRGEKIIVYKYKRRKKYRLKQGHRQSYTEVVIKEINA